MKVILFANLKRILGLATVSLLFPWGDAHADYLDDIGYTALVQELQASGTTPPDGSGVSVTQVEAT